MAGLVCSKWANGASADDASADEALGRADRSAERLVGDAGRRRGAPPLDAHGPPLDTRDRLQPCADTAPAPPRAAQPSAEYDELRRSLTQARARGDFLAREAKATIDEMKRARRPAPQGLSPPAVAATAQALHLDPNATLCAAIAAQIDAELGLDNDDEGTPRSVTATPPMPPS
ncbi:hypothetical protein M885DRAFT_541733 [Pelagophyceae sp. CCMP2097]|nr:hypothetical protein M885DRAFT_541733 [Pelagophyceae sp. CCMP2097]|mmetsp:Transcript_2372/g.8578  ORF Transcript_2372/g.8578 Transcript_2372/m.8578 type:complete len:174 (-) Transcript_2372:56-577(-)